MAWSVWESLGGTLASSPAVCSWDLGRLDVFAQAADGALVHRWIDRNTGWSGWENMNAPVPFTGPPAAVSRGSGRIDLLFRDNGSALWMRRFDSSAGGWSSWENLGGSLRSEPAVSSWSPDRFDLFAQGADGTVQHRWFDTATGWSAWESIGAPVPFTGAPAAVSWRVVATFGPHRIDVFVRGTDTALWHKRYDELAGGWSGWESLGGELASSPAASSGNPGRLDVYARSRRGGVLHRSFDEYAGGWSGWETLGPPTIPGPGAGPPIALVAGAPAAASWGRDYIDVFARGSDNVLWHRTWRILPVIRLHVKIITDPVISIDAMVGHMREVYSPAGIWVEWVSTERLTQLVLGGEEPLPSVVTLNDLDINNCEQAEPTTPEQDRLFSYRDGVGPDEIVVYFVRSTNPPYEGCAVHPPGRPGAVLARGAGEWVLGHEVGHVLGLKHVANTDRLMYGPGFLRPTNPPPDLAPDEVGRLLASPYTIDT